MATLLLRLCGPMQSWGTRSRFTERDTELEPSKSGVIGLVCAALGRPRGDDVSDLAALKMGVRVDHEGVLQRDYHTAGGAEGDFVVRASGECSRDAVLSNRYYLADADFLVGLEGDDRPLLESIDAALRSPVWQLSLGRKSFVPSVPVYVQGGGLRDLPLDAALEGEPWPLEPLSLPKRRWERLMTERRPLRVVLEADIDADGHEIRMDQPIGAAFRDRTFGPRAIVQRYIEKEPNNVPEPAPAEA